MAEVLEVEKRDRVGTGSSQKLRQAGRVPAVLYGHGEANEHLSIPVMQVKSLIRHHSKTVELAGAVKDTALVSNIQWDPLGIEVLHLDLIRVNLKELVEVTVPIHSVGDAVGVREGGILIENLHQVDVKCSAGSIPDHLNVNVNELQLGASLTAGDLDLPEGVTLLTDKDSVVVHIEEPRGQESDSEEAGEQEVIGKGGDDAKKEEG
ncbi:MAG: 50S ribosomal protein L25 [Rubripirellula sp.]